MRRSFVISLAFCIGISLIGVGCSRPNEEAKDGTKKYITIKGSDTMVHLASNWSEKFMEDNPGLEVSITGGGSGTGIAALMNNMTDICTASRSMKKKEISVAEQKGIHPEEIIVARDGIAVVVNPANPINELTLEQIKKIYTGAYTKWSQLGGPDKDIVVLSRESSSGTYVFFQEHVLKKEDYTQKAMLLPATSSIIQTTSTNKWAIGYVGLAYASKAAKRVKTISVKVDKNSTPIAPSEETVKSGKYSIARPLYLYTNGKPTGTVKKFIDFTLSSVGQAIVSKTGYISEK